MSYSSAPCVYFNKRPPTKESSRVKYTVRHSKSFTFSETKLLVQFVLYDELLFMRMWYLSFRSLKFFFELMMHSNCSEDRFNVCLIHLIVKFILHWGRHTCVERRMKFTTGGKIYFQYKFSHYVASNITECKCVTLLLKGERTAQYIPTRGSTHQCS